MKAIVIGRAGSHATMEALMAVFPRHKEVVDAFVARGELIGVGAFSDRSGSLAIFRNRAAAEAFVKQDPFILEGLIATFEIQEWGDQLLA